MKIKYNKDDLKRACNIVKKVLGVEYRTRDINNIQEGEERLLNIVYKFLAQHGTSDNVFKKVRTLEQENTFYQFEIERLKGINTYLKKQLEKENTNILKKILGWFK